MNWNNFLTHKAIPVSNDILALLVDESIPMTFNNEIEYQVYLLKYLNDIFLTLGISKPKWVKRNYDFGAYGRRSKFDILIQHEDDSVSIIECKYSKDISPSERLINQVRGMGQLMLYGEMFNSVFQCKARLYLSDEKPEELILNLLKKQDIGFIAVKEGRIFTMNPYK